MTEPIPPNAKTMSVEAIATQIVAALLRASPEFSEATGALVAIDPEAAKEQAKQIVATHAGILSQLSVGALFDLLETPPDPASYADELAAMTDDQLRAEVLGTSIRVDEIRAHRLERLALNKDLAAAAQVVIKGVVGAVLVGAIGAL